MSNGEIVQNEDDLIEINLPGTTGFGKGELGQIRNLLFGQHARDTAERVALLEQEVMATISALRADMDAGFAKIESRIAAEVDARTSVATNLVTRIDEEAEARRSAQIDLRTDLDRRAGQIHDQLGAARIDLRDQIENVDADLRQRTVDKEMLASFFESAATNLVSDAD